MAGRLHHLHRSQAHRRGAIQTPAGIDYVDYLMPGLFILAIAFGSARCRPGRRPGPRPDRPLPRPGPSAAPPAAHSSRPSPGSSASSLS
jgi:hypothetical protein